MKFENDMKMKWNRAALPAACVYALAMALVAGCGKKEPQAESVQPTGETQMATASSDAPAEARQPVDMKDRVPLKLDLPKPLFVGTPVPAQVPNMEPPRQGARPDLMVPEGTVNLAKDKKVTASDPEPIIGDLELITDGDKDGEEGYWVEFGPGKQWVQIDLGQSSDVHAIVVWHFHSQARVYHDVVIQVSDDAAFSKNVTTVFNNDHDNSAGLGAGRDFAYVETNEGKLIDAKGVKGRYVRLYSSGNTANKLNHYIEVEVFGKPSA